ncbi:hypothetical protein Mapa_016761 [Marchantia paleacea]|nr:hypothetical protein Mapa_016761 [Marchantia paleacea]
MTTVPKVALGSQGLLVSGQGLGCMGMPAFYGTPKPVEMIDLIQKAVELELGVGIIAYSPLGRGFFSGTNLSELADDDYRKRYDPRFADKNFQENNKFYDLLCEMGAGRNCTPGQLALAWVQHKGVIPIPGTTKLTNLKSNIRSLDIKLTTEDIQALEAAVPMEEVQGDRYIDMSYTWRVMDSPPLES